MKKADLKNPPVNKCCLQIKGAVNYAGCTFGFPAELISMSITFGI